MNDFDARCFERRHKGFGASAGGFAQFLGSLFGGGRASGGPIYPGRAYLVGEQGPELIMPGTASTVVPNHQLAGSSSIHNTFVIPSTGNRLSESQLAKELNDRQRLAASRNR